MQDAIIASLPPEPTLDEVRAALAPLLGRHAAFDGWNKAAVASAARQAGVDPAMAALCFSGPTDMIDAWFASIDSRMAAQWPADRLAGMKVRERITALVETRLALVEHEREALRRALAILAMPQNLAKGAKLGWRAADVMWRCAGDNATDYNHYTKRATLSAVYASTLMVFLDDESGNLAQTRAFLSRRIDGIMRFEKAKARMAARVENRPSLSRFVGRLRYPAN